MNKSIVKPNSSVISSQLLDLSEENEPIVSNSIVTEESGNKVAVRITAEDVDKLIPNLEANYGFEVIASSPENYFVEGFVPANSIPKLTSLSKQGLMGVLPIIEPSVNVGNTTSQASFVHESDRVNDTVSTGYDGTGVTIGIMSDSYDDLGGAAGDVLSGDLPAAGVNVLQDYGNNGSDEGRGMAQLVHDLAPGADLAFSSVFFGEADFAQQIRDLADPSMGNADVLVDDVSYFFEPYFQDGVVAQAVDDVVTNDGVSYFSSAGNSDDKSFESDNINFVDDVDLEAKVTYSGNTYYDFDTGAEVDTTQNIGLSDGQTIQFVFQWDDPFYTLDGVDADLDLYLLDATGTVVAESTTNNIGSQTPVEYLTFTDDTTNSSTDTYDLVIAKYGDSSNPGIIKYINRGNTPVSLEYAHDASTVVGHSAAENAQAVAAVAWFDQDNPESFTSKGSTTIAFEADGTPKAAVEVRQTPDISAIDGTNTTFFGNDISLDIDSFPNFFGTSAAAPHAAAIAALIEESDPSLTSTEIYARLQNTAKDIGEPGFDDLTGVGLINAYDAIYGAPMAATLDFSDDFENGVLGSAYETNTTGAGRIKVTGDNDPIDTAHLTLDSSAEGKDSLNEVILHLDATNFSNVQLSFEQKEFGDEDHPMSASFVDSENSDGVALSVDGTVWHSLVSLTGSNSTETYQTNLFDLSTFATDKGLTLGSDVQIKFQQFDTHSISSDGMAFDNIAITGDSTVSITPTNEDDSLTGTIGNDTINSLWGNDIVDGLSGNDSLFGANGNDTLLGNDGIDTLHGGNGNDSLDGGNDNDILNGGNNEDYLSGGDGLDTIQGASGDDTLLGGADNDVLFGYTANDSLDGGSGNDSLIGLVGNDTLLGDAGNDFLRGQAEDDWLSGGDGNDFMIADNGNDYLEGGDGQDTLVGGGNDDTLLGGLGIDFMFGSAGVDTFAIDTSLTTNDRDIMPDFTLGTDVLGVSNLSMVDDLTVSNNGGNTASIVTGGSGQSVAILVGVTNITISDLDFVEV